MDRGSRIGNVAEQLMVYMLPNGTETIPTLQEKELLNPMNFKLATAFDEKLFKQNGHKLLESFKNNWQPDFEFHCYYYNMDIE